MYELADNIILDESQLALIRQYSNPILQRLGYIMKVLELEDLETQLFDICKNIGLSFKYVALKASAEKHVEDERDERWKIIINQEVNIDEI